MGKGSGGCDDRSALPMDTRYSQEMDRPTPTMEQLISLCKRRGFVFQASEIYGGFANTYDYAHYGVLLKEQIRQLWWKSMVHTRSDVIAFDSAIIQNPKVWEASGHASGFSDPKIDCKTCKMRFRADHAEDTPCPRKPSKHVGAGPQCELTDEKEFNLMFKTAVGAVDGSDAYLRPETAQGIIINFMSVVKNLHRTPPFGIAQVGKSFRNEITPSNFIFRTREFEQMEMEFFTPESEAQEWYQYWREARLQWYLDLGINPAHLRIREHAPDELAHYARAVVDIEYKFEKDWGELEGVAWRGNFDLKQHQAASGQTLSVKDADGNDYIPHIIEPAAGLDRVMLATLADAYEEETLEDGSVRTVLHLNPKIAPVTVAVLPLVKKDGQPEQAKAIHEKLQTLFRSEYDQTGAIGKRYRRQDEIGTPWCVAVDHQTAEDGTVTIRDRDSLEQIRIHQDELVGWFANALTT